MIEYRKATIGDMDALIKVRLDFLSDIKVIGNKQDTIWMEKCNRDFFTEALQDSNYSHWMTLEDNKIIATGSVSFYKLPPHPGRPNAKVAYIANMFTYPQFRRRGIAKKLLALLTEEAKEYGCNQVLLNATEMGKPVYEKFGFQLTGDEMLFINR